MYLFNVVQNSHATALRRDLSEGWPDLVLMDQGLPPGRSKIKVLHVSVVLDMSHELNKQTAGDWDSIKANYFCDAPAARIGFFWRQTAMHQHLSCAPPFLWTWSVPDRSQHLGCIKGGGRELDWRLSSWHWRSLINIKGSPTFVKTADLQIYVFFLFHCFWPDYYC